MVSMAVIHFAVKPAIFFEPAWLLPITNAVFVTGVCFVVAYVAMKNYLATARIQILLLGCGLLSFGLGGVIAGWVRSFPDGANLNVTIYNTAALLGAIFHFVAAFILLAGVSPEVGAKQKKKWLVFSYAVIAAFTALFTLATMRRIIPAFFVQGVGPTALRQVVLGSADVLFIFSFLIFMGWYLRRGEAFLYWYASALALTAISLTGFFIQSAVGSPIGWLSRFSQYLGGIYFIVAVATAIRTARVRKTSIDLALAAALSPSEESFLRTTFDNMAERLIVCDSQGNILLVNDAARKTYGIEEQVPWQVSTLNEAIEVLDLDGRPLPLSLRPLTRILRGEQIRSTELRLRVKATGQESILSYNGTPIRDRNGSVVMAILTSEDITERKQAEEALRLAEAERKATEVVHAERQRLLDVLETLPVIVTLLRSDHRVAWVNRAYREALGDNVGRLCFESQFGLDKPCVECQAFTPLQTSQPHNWEWTLTDGRTFDIHNFPFVDADGSPLILEMDIDITERRRAEEALRRANAYNRSLLEASLDPLVTIGPDGKITDVNATTEAATGHPRPALIGTDFSDYFTEPEKARAGYQQVFRDGFVRDYPLELRHRDGHVTSVLYNASIYRDAVGQVVGVFAAARDITERRRVEAELAKHHQHLEELVKERTSQLETANAVLSGINAIFEEALKCESDEELGQTCLRVAEQITGSKFGFIGEIGEDGLFHDIAVSDIGWELCSMYDQSGHRRSPGKFAIRSLYGRVLKDGKSLMTNDPPRHPDSLGTPLGHPPLTAFLGVPLIDSGRTIGMIAVANRDGGYREQDAQSLEALAPAIIEALHRARAERALRSNEARLRLSLNAAKSGTWEWDLRTNKNKWSYEIWGLFGLKPYSCESSYENWLSAVHPEDREMTRQKTKEAAAGSTELNVEYRVPDGSGGVRWLAARGRALFDGRGDAVSYIGIAMDITEHKRAEQALIRSEKLASVGRMAATMAHEINNPLEAVTNTLFIAKGIEGLPEPARQYLETADAELKRIAHITRQSLGFYRESNSPTLTSVTAVLDSAVDLLKNKTKAKHAVIDKQWDGDVQITAVASELRQVFSNLLANSLDAIDERGVIALRVSAALDFKNRRCVRVTVADNGKGVGDSSRPHIFEPFFTTKGAVGTGLGLWISKQIVEKHGGNIRMRSRISGTRRGTVFSILLPAQPAVAARSQSAGA
jgi:PAS domain S-box-containing protein